MKAAAAKPSKNNDGDRIRGFEGEGHRQYLTGLRMGGSHVLILVDASTSMLDRTIVNVIRRRNMPPDQQRKSPKWQQAVNTVDWLTTQIKPGTNVQIIAFTDKAITLTPNTDGKWITLTDGSELDAAMTSLKGMVPKGPTSLHAAFTAARMLEPKPDNIYLITDGLPTMGEIVPARQGATGRERLDHFNRAVRQLPVGVAREHHPARRWKAIPRPRPRSGCSLCGPAARCSRRPRIGHETPPRARSVQHVVPRRDLLRLRVDHSAVHHQPQQRSRFVSSRARRTSRA